MADKKIVHSENKVSEDSQFQTAKPVGNPTGLRIGAIVCWLLGLGCEVMAILALVQKIHIFVKNEKSCQWKNYK